MKKSEILIDLCRYTLLGTPIDDAVRAANSEQLEAVFRLGQKHNVAHLAADAMVKNGLAVTPSVRNGALLTVHRTAVIESALAEARTVLQAAGIDFLPLKGSVVRALYPEPWMRTSSDIDILVHRDSLPTVERELTAAGYRLTSKGSHDWVFTNAAKVALEMHYDTVEEGRASGAGAVLKHIWEYAEVHDGHEYRLRDEMLYFYHIAHMAKHFEVGGCGIRPFFDLYYLEHGITFDAEARAALLRQGELTEFAAAAHRLSEVWLGDAPTDADTGLFAEFVITGGMFGTVDNRVVMQQRRQGGADGYVRSRLFLPYDRLVREYPWIQGKKILMPAAQICRIVRMLRGGRLRRHLREAKLSRTASEQQLNRAEKLFDYLGL